MPITNLPLEELISASESTITLYRNGSRRSGQKLFVSITAMHKAIADVKKELSVNSLRSSYNDLVCARQRFVASLKFNLDPGHVVLGCEDKKYLSSAINDLWQIQLGASAVIKPVATREQPARIVKRNRSVVS